MLLTEGFLGWVGGVLIEYKILYRVKDSIALGKTKGFIKTKSLGGV
jgi:hypothetical protein